MPGVGVGNEQIALLQGENPGLMLKLAAAGKDNAGLVIGMPMHPVPARLVKGQIPALAVADVMEGLLIHA